MFTTKESLYINVIKYDSQLKLDYKKIKNEQIIHTDNSVFLINDDILSTDIAQKLNTSQEENDFTYISTLLLNKNNNNSFLQTFFCNLKFII